MHLGWQSDLARGQPIGGPCALRPKSLIAARDEIRASHWRLMPWAGDIDDGNSTRK